MRKFLFLFFAALVVMNPRGLVAEVPNEINYQGRLREYGQPVTADRAMNFKIYAVESGGVPVWSSGDVVVAVTTGTFNYTLSPSGVDWRWKDFWVETTVAGKILSPREKIAAGVYALHSRTAEDISKTSGTVIVKIGDTSELAITTFTVSAEFNRVVNVSTPTAYDDGATKGYVDTWLPTGTILMWGGTQASIPSGWYLCAGSAISRTTDARLFAVIGTLHGVGDGVTTFNLPNLRDRFIVGAGNSYAVAAIGGAASHAHAVNSHSHTISHTHTMQHTHAFSGTTSNATWAGGDPLSWGSSISAHHTHTYSGTTGNASTATTSDSSSANSGSASPGTDSISNLPPYFALCYIIKN